MENNEFNHFSDLWKEADTTGFSQKQYSKRDITEIIHDVFTSIKSFFSKGSKKVTFSSLTPTDSKEDRIYTFIPLLHLANQDHRKIDLFQEQHFGDIEVTLAPGKPVEKQQS